MCCSSARSQRLIVEECLLYVCSFAVFMCLRDDHQLDNATQGIWQTPSFAGCYSKQASRYDRTSREHPELVGESDISDE